jgi:hypothetical protein
MRDSIYLAALVTAAIAAGVESYLMNKWAIS